MPDASYCPACRAEIGADARFCAQCGQRLTPTLRDDAERRHLTVLFCDLADSTQLALRLDPEDLRTVMREYHSACAEVIAREDGHVSQFLGDGMLVFFGYPHAHEDDAARAVRAALGILEEMRRVNVSLALPEVRLAVRIGIDSGPVVIGDTGDERHRETQAVGHAMPRAARLQAVAPPDGILVSDATLRLLRGLFVTRTLGPQTFKGFSEPVVAHQVLHENDTRAGAQSGARLTSLAGRRGELALCSDRWLRAHAGHGQGVLLEAEAGMGKSRLVRVLRERSVARDERLWIECRGSAQHADSALFPIIDLLRRALGFDRDDPPGVCIAKLERELSSAGMDLPDVVPLLAALLSLPPPATYPPLALSPAAQRRRTLAALVDWLLAPCQRMLVVFVMEDLHWVDPSTLEFLDAVIARVPTSRMLFIGTFRPGFESRWRSLPSFLHLTLQPLAAEDSRAIIDDLARGKALPEELTRDLIARTDGMPIFVEELTKMVLESGILEEHADRFELRGPLPPVAIPATLQDSLMARLDRLADAKGVAQLAATIGRAFSYELIASLASLPATLLRAELDRLVAAEILVERGGPTRSEYAFRHALIQEVAYESLLRARRRQLHQRIAVILQDRFPESVEQQPEILAHHFQEAGLAPEAIAAWRAAGSVAMARSAMVEALRHYRRALEMLEGQPKGLERDRLELALQAALSIPVIATRGYGTREAERAIARARELCEQLGNAPEHFPVLRGAWTFYEVRADYRAAREVALRLTALADASGDPVLQVGALHSIGITNLFLGEFAAARAQLERAVALYDPARQRAGISLTPMDPGVGARGFGALALWFEGRPDAARQLSEPALPLAESLAQPFNVCWAQILCGWIDLMRGAWQAARERAEAAVAISREQAFQNSAALGTLIGGYACWRLGDRELGIERLREGLAGWRAVGTDMGRSLFLCWHADACMQSELQSEATAALDEAALCVARGPERFAAAEVERMRGELELARASHDELEAQRCFARAIEIADAQGALSLQLRAVTSAARLAQQRGCKQEAFRMLEPIVARFTEGFASSDLREAGELLATL